MKFESEKDLPTQKVLVAYFKTAIKLNEAAVAAPKKKSKPRPAPETPADLQAELDLKKNRRAKDAFDQFSPSHKREYVEWITEAKREATRAKRLAQTIEWLAEGKSRNWKYTNC